MQTKAYITANKGWQSAPMDEIDAKCYAFLLIMLGNVNVRVCQVALAA